MKSLLGGAEALSSDSSLKNVVQVLLDVGTIDNGLNEKVQRAKDARNMGKALRGDSRDDLWEGKLSLWLNPTIDKL